MLTELYKALAVAQGELKNPEKTKQADTGKYKYMYADIGDVLEAVMPVLSKHGLSISQPTVIRDNSIILVTRLHHESGQHIESEYPVCSLNGNHQAMGAAMTYARRYALTSLIGVAAVDDTDGADAAPVGEGERVRLSSSQAKTEINWEAIQKDIDACETFKRLDNWAEKVEQRKNVWPSSYYTAGKERVLQNRLDLADRQMTAARDADDLSNIFTDLEAILDKKVPYDDLAGLYRKHEDRLLLTQHPMNGG